MYVVDCTRRTSLKKFVGRVCVPEPPRWRETEQRIDMWWVRDCLLANDAGAAPPPLKVVDVPTEDAWMVKRRLHMGPPHQPTAPDRVAFRKQMRHFEQVADFLQESTDPGFPTVTEDELCVPPVIAQLRKTLIHPPYVIAAAVCDEVARSVVDAVRISVQPKSDYLPDECGVEFKRGRHGVLLVEVSRSLLLLEAPHAVDCLSGKDGRPNGLPSSVTASGPASSDLLPVSSSSSSLPASPALPSSSSSSSSSSPVRPPEVSATVFAPAIESDRTLLQLYASRNQLLRTLVNLGRGESTRVHRCIPPSLAATNGEVQFPGLVLFKFVP